MNGSALLPLLLLLSSLIPALLIFALREPQAVARNCINLTGAVVKLALVAGVLWGVYRGWRFEFAYELLPDVAFSLRIDALAMLFVTLSAVLWLLTTVYAIGYLAGTPNQRRFFGFFSLCVAATVGIALAGNLFTFFLFYELLTLSTYPLVVHRGNRASLQAGRIYLAYTVAGGAVLLVGIAWLYVLVGPVGFVEQGGALRGVSEELYPALRWIFVLLVAGFAVKAALVPLHIWLPMAMVAPAPVSALLHAVAVVKAGAFGIVRVIYDVYGIDLARTLDLGSGLLLVTVATIVYGSLRALQQDDLKRRLAYSTVSQLSYIVLGASILTPAAIVGALVHLVHQGVMKITLFFCAGIFAETLGVHKVSELNGIGRRMPWTMTAFTISGFGMMALPPTAGFISKWYLGLGAVQGGYDWVLFVLLLSGLLNAAYFLPAIYRGWFGRREGEWPHERYQQRLETKASLLVPPLVTAALTLFFGLFAGWVLSPLYWAELIAQLEMGR
ncbi:proton-conducting membrane transporter [Alkalilimnicola ehrlichii]|uniref:Proton-conducting membrane transporter n=1 Tax=Alkalilimnicola ehrlichii TaxID=351052 RepID=A0A3E0X0P6_9GAMM|nr:proton-conducting transporter membrane subunit [Alkalilimnicola ehrlichii]RFA31029.1 proton-conducting membrane transporter [Alkalilimnicola ehrlichii]RFA38982.1 proton-conducting membrane transporter [Alkalilimnicola ehrlichii]